MKRHLNTILFLVLPIFLSIESFGQCEITISPLNPTICENASVTLTADTMETTEGGCNSVNKVLIWNDDSNLTGTEFNFIAQNSTSYSVKLYDSSDLMNPIHEAVTSIDVYTPTAAFEETSISICEGESNDLEVNLTGTPPWNFMVMGGGSLYTVSNTSNNPHFVNVSTVGEHSIINIVDGNGCEGTAGNVAMVTQLSSPDVSDLEPECLPDGDSYVITGDVPGGSEDFDLDGISGSWNGSTFTSEDIVSGNPYDFFIIGDNNCESVDVMGSLACECELTAELSGGGSICADSSLFLTVEFIGGQEPYSFWYSLFDNDSVLVTGIETTTFSFEVNVEGTYSLDGVSDGLCTGTPIGNDATVAVFELANAAITYDPFCAGTEGLPSDIATSNGLFELIGNTSGQIDSITGGITGAVQNEMYTVQYTTTNQMCNSDSTFIVQVYDSPEIESFIIDDVSLCIGSNDFTLEVIVSDVNKNYNYTWSSEINDIFSIPVSTPNSATIDVGTMTGSSWITFEVEGENCWAADSIQLFVNPEVVVSTLTGSPSLSACMGDTIVVNANPTGGTPDFFNPVWSSIDGILELIPGSASNTSASYLAVFPTEGLEITYEITDAEGCTGDSNAELIVFDNPSSQGITGDFNSMCQNGIINLEGNPNGGTGVYQAHTWESSTTGLSTIPNDESCLVFGAMVGSDGIIQYTVEDDNGCMSEPVDYAINVLSQPEVSLTQVGGVCIGDTVKIGINPLGEEYDFLTLGSTSWLAGNIPIDPFEVIEDTLFVFYAVDNTNSIIYSVDPMYDQDELGCGMNNVPLLIEPQISPEPIIASISDADVCANQQSVFISQDNRDGSTFVWNFPAGTDSLLFDTTTVDGGQTLIVNWGSNLPSSLQLEVVESVSNNCSGNDFYTVNFSNQIADLPADIFFSPVNDILIYNDADPVCYQWGYIDDVTKAFVEEEGEVFQSYVVQGYDPTTTYWCKAWGDEDTNCDNLEVCVNMAITRDFVSNVIIDRSPYFELYPNPNNGSFNLRMNNLFSDTKYDVSIANSFGQIIYERDVFSGNQSFNVEFNNDNLPAGLYHLIVARNGVLTKSTSFVVQP